MCCFVFTSENALLWWGYSVRGQSLIFVKEMLRDLRTSKHIMEKRKKEPENRGKQNRTRKELLYWNTPGCSPTTRCRHIDPIKMIFYWWRSIKNWPDTFSVAAKALFSKQRFWQLAPSGCFCEKENVLLQGCCQLERVCLAAPVKWLQPQINSCHLSTRLRAPTVAQLLNPIQQLLYSAYPEEQRLLMACLVIGAVKM